MGDPTERDDRPQIGHRRHFARQMRIALADFGSRWLVGRWQTAHGVGDAAISKQHLRIRPEIVAKGIWLAGEAVFIERRIKQFAGNIAAKGSPGPIGPFFSRRQPDDQNARIQLAKSRHRQIVPIGVAFAQETQVFRQTRTGDAANRVFKSRHGGNVSMAPMQRNWDIFCRVIDNYGDIGVCWRLARQLVREHGLTVRLWVDQPEALAAICPAVNPLLPAQHVEGAEIRHWASNFPETGVADVVIEAFACELPASYVQSMAAAYPQPRWINLEYLTAEPWAESCHGLASPHPSLGLTKHFYFPGFSSATGGLLLEAGLIDDRLGFQKRLPPKIALEICLFCYESAPVGELIRLLSESQTAVHCYVPPGKPMAAVSAYLGGLGPWQIGALKVMPIPFLTQDEFDRLLWRCDINFVRGEDSLVRAIWAGRPMIWQIYEQEDLAHLNKLAAFLDNYAEDMPEALSTALKAMFMAWNTGEGLMEAWPAFLKMRQQVAESHKKWAKNQVDRGDLASNLVKFCAKDI